MKKALKYFAKQLLPDQLFTKFASIRSRNFQYKFLEKQGLHDVNNQMIDHYGLDVLHGPFRGMKYPRNALVSRHGTPKLLGSYEQELHSIILEVIENSYEYDKFVDIGCAEGYYAVGLAVKTGKVVDAFDTEPRELALCCEMAKLNQVDVKVNTKRWCDSKYLQSLKGSRCFILSDCEGYEAKLFTTTSTLGLACCDLIIELHNIDNVNMSKLISERFRNTHDIKIISSETRNPKLYEELEFLGKSASHAVSEYRDAGQEWIHLKARI